jgi:hypothetical protein
MSAIQSSRILDPPSNMRWEPTTKDPCEVPGIYKYIKTHTKADVIAIGGTRACKISKKKLAELGGTRQDSETTITDSLLNIFSESGCEGDGSSYSYGQVILALQQDSVLRNVRQSTVDFAKKFIYFPTPFVPVPKDDPWGMDQHGKHLRLRGKQALCLPQLSSSKPIDLNAKFLDRFSS